MELSDVLSIIAIIVAALCVFYEIYSSKKINKVNLESKYYEKIFDEILLYEIPKARNYFVHIGGKLEGTNKLQQAMISLRKKSLFFKYKDLEFYVELSGMCMDIEDYLFNSEGVMTKEEYEKFEYQIDNKLEGLYNLISNQSVG